jgi:hypothetical protein
MESAAVIAQGLSWIIARSGAVVATISDRGQPNALPDLPSLLNREKNLRLLRECLRELRT